MSLSPATAESNAVDGLLRIISAQAAITLYCGKDHTIDDALSHDLGKTARDTLQQVLGTKGLQKALDAESERRQAEIEAVGPSQWCDDQRSLLNADGLRVFSD